MTADDFLTLDLAARVAWLDATPDEDADLQALCRTTACAGIGSGRDKQLAEALREALRVRDEERILRAARASAKTKTTKRPK